MNVNTLHITNIKMLSCPYLVCRKISSKKHYDVSEIFVSLFPNSSETANPNELRFWLYPRRGKGVGLWCPPPARVRHLDSQMGGGLCSRIFLLWNIPKTICYMRDFPHPRHDKADTSPAVLPPPCILKFFIFFDLTI